MTSRSPSHAPSVEHFFGKNLGTVQIPVDSFHATSGGRKMVITHEIYWIDHHRAPQRQHYEVYQTSRFNSSNSYPHCHAGLAQSRRLRQNDADLQGLSHF